MLTPDDEFDLDVRLTGLPDVAHGFLPGLFAGDATPTAGPACDPLQGTLAIDCGPTNGCTDDCPTRGCNTSETCENIMCGSDAITFGSYCVDDSGGEDTCMACPGGPGEGPETPDVPGTRGRWCP